MVAIVAVIDLGVNHSIKPPLCFQVTSIHFSALLQGVGGWRGFQHTFLTEQRIKALSLLSAWITSMQVHPRSTCSPFPDKRLSLCEHRT